MARNAAESFVSKLCTRSFLGLWSYPNPQGKNAGKELCDFLVVCDPDVIVFSVKDVAYKDTGRPDVDLSRWQREAVDKSVKQVYGAERRLGDVDLVTTQSGQAGLSLPEVAVRRVHRVAVALGGENKVLLSSRDYGKGYVHVFDQPAFGTIIQELDTISDFVAYLRAKEGLKARILIEGGEEDLLALYLRNGRAFPADYDEIILGSDLWRDFLNSPEHQAKREADRPSYVWDKIIDLVGSDAFDGRLLGNPSLDEVEQALRAMAREDRFSRRGLGKAFTDFLAANRDGRSWGRMFPNRQGDVTYVFVGCPLETPRADRFAQLQARCLIARGLYPDIETVVGIATERQSPERKPGFSLDLAFLRMAEWTEEDQRSMEELQAETGFFLNPRQTRAREDEYPPASPDKASARPARGSECGGKASAR